MVDTAIEELRLRKNSALAKLIKSLKYHVEHFSDDCENNVWVKNFPKKKDDVVYEKDDGSLVKYNIYDVMLSLFAENTNITPEQRVVITRYIDLAAYKAEMSARHSWKRSGDSMEDFVTYLQIHDKMHPEDCKNHVWVRNFPTRDARVSFVDKDGNVVECHMYNLVRRIDEEKSKITQEQRESIKKLVDIEAYKAELASRRCMAGQARGATDKLISLLEKHNEAHPEDCVNGKWVWNLPTPQSDRVLYDYISNLKKGIYIVTAEQSDRIDELIDFSFYNNGHHNKFEPKSTNPSTANKYICILEEYVINHPEDCENGKLTRNFPERKAVLEEGKRYDMEITFGTLTVKLQKLTNKAERYRVSSCFDWLAYKAERAKEKETKQGELAGDVVKTAVATSKTNQKEQG